MNAFFAEKTETYAIQGFGYLEPSRVWNVDTFTYQQRDQLYINRSRNVFANDEYREMVDKVIGGIEVQQKIAPPVKTKRPSAKEKKTRQGWETSETSGKTMRRKSKRFM